MLPRVILHTAVSIDGRIDWFTPDLGLYYELATRFGEDATLAGSETMLAGSGEIPPETEADLTPPAVEPGDPRPLLVVPDSRGRLRGWHFWRTLPYWRGMVSLCSNATPKEHLAYLRERHVDCIVAGEERVDLRAALEELNARYGTKVVRVDSGGTLSGVLLRAGLVDEVSLLICPSLVGGTSPRSFFRAPDLTTAEGVIPARLTHLERLNGDVVWLRYEVAKE
jgi:2,5-diamino-6-(ribosylamino)-4(3H)-pyrimidinone 5'-phosphate reductase